MIPRRLAQWTRAGLVLGAMAAAVTVSPLIADGQMRDDGDHAMEVTSTTFTNDSTLPLSTIFNYISNGVNICTANGAAGLDQSPELSWTHAPRHTRSFVVVLYDTTAAFTHWGMYNISGNSNGLPENAGIADSTYGMQIDNDFGDPHYDGPCPPAGVEPFTHHYVFTVYALDTQLTLESSTNFPANAETLYHALIRAGREGHILASASITGLFSATPSD
jgi:Raf kinase inhibitor-like YbhB/YbcL family protein